LDQTLLYFFNITLASPSLDIVFISLTHNGYLLYIPFVIYLFVSSRDLTKWSFAVAVLLLVLGLNDWLSNETKSLFYRPRPCLSIEWIRGIIGCADTSSMPSSHASNAFAVSMVLYYYSRVFGSPLWMRTCVVALAVLIALSRVYLGVHYPTDVLSGAVLGITVAVSVIAASKLFKEQYHKRPAETVLFFLTLALSLFRIYYIRHGGLDLSPDEAHYWEWSRRLDWSYYSKGPLVALFIKAGTLLFGNTIMAIRLNAVVMLALSGLILYCLTKEVCLRSYHGSAQQCEGELTAKQAGLLAFILLQVVPLFSTFGIVFTIDPPLILFWTLSLYLFWKIIDNKGPSVLWILLGLTIGLGLLAKYTVALFIGCAFIYLSLYERRLLLKPHPYIALMIATIVFMPVLYWNYQNNWLTLRHTAGMANVSSGFVVDWRHLVEFVGSQIGVVSPVVFFMMLASLWKIRNIGTGRVARFVLCFSVPVLLFFLLKSLQGKVQANWAMPGYISAIIALSVLWAKGMALPGFTFQREAAIVVSVALSVACLISLIGLYPQAIKLPADLDPSARLRGWTMLAHRIEAIIEPLRAKGPLIIFTPDYQTSSELAFYLKGNPITYCINLGRRMNQYDLWEDTNSAIQRLRASNSSVNGLFVYQLGDDISHVITPYCERHKRQIVSIEHKGRHLRSYGVVICYNLHSVPDKKATTY